MIPGREPAFLEVAAGALVLVGPALAWMFRTILTLRVLTALAVPVTVLP